MECVPRLCRTVLVLLLALTGVGPALLAAADATTEAAIAPADLEFFERQIRPVLAEKCYTCHSEEARILHGGLRLDSRQGIEAGGDSGPVVETDDPSNSLLLAAIRYETFEMPPDGRLDDAVIADFEEWVRRGAPHPRSSGSSPEAAPINGDRHWAFQPVSAASPPAVRNSDWVHNPIDAFVLARLEAAGLEPALPADKATLLRRVTFDLTGLPPTPAEVDAFLSDDSPDSYERVVERLLASPHYGERWGRHWLDYVRYADTNGADENHQFPQAWRYRDWVVQACNSGLPYDEFLIHQLAGDLLPKPDNEIEAGRLLTATGLLVVGPKMLAEQDKEKMEADIVDEQIDVVSKTVLGLTIACARCHDHKFDPVPTTDYYALAGIFASTRTMADRAFVSKWMERPLPSAAIAAARAEAEAKVAETKAALDAATDLPDDEKTKRKAEIEAQEKALPAFEMVMAVDEATPHDVPVHIRGDHLRPAETPTPRGVPQILEQTVPFAGIPDGRSGRLALARWLTEPSHPLTARVAVNRIWMGHFAEGLVRTPSDFGLTGEPPTHPELLDWLADEYVRSGWATKNLHRLIVLSSAYRMSSQPDFAAEELDPENRLLRRQNRRRLEAEPIRDALLAAGDSLDKTIGGIAPNVEASRRAVYLPINRSALYPMFATFDYAVADAHLDQRPTTTVPPQALFLMNSPLAETQAKRLADSLSSLPGSDDDRIEAAFLRLFARGPTPAESDRTLAFLDRMEAAADGTSEQRRSTAWAALAAVLLATNEFIYVE